MAKNGISKFPTKGARQLAKLEISEKKRQGFTVRPNGAIAGVEDPTRAYYRYNNYYDRTLLPSQYLNEAFFDNNTPLIPGRPWSPLTGSTLFFDTIRLEDDNVMTLENGVNTFSLE
jgi:hypothetical protein